MDHDSDALAVGLPGDEGGYSPADGPAGTGAAAWRLTEDAVAAYLDRNRDFFVQRVALLRQMTPPPRFEGDCVIDLQRKRVDVLQDELAGLRDCASTVIETSRANLAVQQRMHAAVLRLIGADSREAILGVVSDELPQLLGVDVARLALEVPDPDALPDDIAALPPGIVTAVLGHGTDTLLLPEIADDGTLFGGAADEIRSAALVRLRLTQRGEDALIVFGSCEPGAFSPRQGTELLEFLANVVAWCLDRQPVCRS
jgi:uncharacterized protein YigA (DUF484 family)